MLDKIIEECNTDSRKLAVHKFCKKNGYTAFPPLFLNNKGERITHKTITNIIYPVKAELEEQGIMLNKTFHDLRATYALDRVLKLWEKGNVMENIRFIVADELGHKLFETTKRYLVIKGARENWISQSGIGKTLENNNIPDNNQFKDTFNDFL